MCGRFIQIVDVELLVKRFGVKNPEQISVQSNFNVSPGDSAYVITNDKPDELQAFEFAFTPSWAKKKMYLINARAEGDLNKENDPNYKGEMGILKKPSFRTAIRSRRCLVIANGYFEGPEEEKLSKPFHISKKNGEVFCFAGIWDTWIDHDTGEVDNTFGIITVVPNSISQQIGHHRSPLVLAKKDEKRWLDHKLPIEEVLSLLKPYPGEEFKAEAVSIRVKNPRNKGKDILIPINQGGSSEYDISAKKTLKLQGMGQNKRKETPPPQQGSLF